MRPRLKLPPRALRLRNRLRHPHQRQWTIRFPLSLRQRLWTLRLRQWQTLHPSSKRPNPIRRLRLSLLRWSRPRPISLWLTQDSRSPRLLTWPHSQRWNPLSWTEPLAFNA
jgi:hypothetical protein